MREEDPGPPSVVVYIVNPFDESEDQNLRKESYFGLLRGFAEMASALPQEIKSQLVLEVSQQKTAAQDLNAPGPVVRSPDKLSSG